MGFGLRFNSHLLDWPFQESAHIPQCNEDDVFSETSAYPSGEANEAQTGPL
jgi:hypothetical protein